MQPHRARRRLHVSQRSFAVAGLFGLTSTAIDRLGHQLAQQLQPLCPDLGGKKLTPVTLPPGRLRLATRPSLTGSPPRAKTIGIVAVAAFAARRRREARRGDHGDLTADQIGRQRRQPVVLTLRPAVFDRDVLALDEAGFLQALAERRHDVRVRRAIVPLRNPITGIAGCCARAASGHAAAAPPSSVMNSRRCSGRDVRFIARPPHRTVRAAFPHTAPTSGV